MTPLDQALAQMGLHGLQSAFPYAGQPPLSSAAEALHTAMSWGPVDPEVAAAAQTILNWHRRQIAQQMQAHVDALAMQRRLVQQREERRLRTWQQAFQIEGERLEELRGS